MDLLTHALMGLCAAKGMGLVLSPGTVALVSVASIAPDLCFFPLGLYLGREQGRFLWVPHFSDWVGARKRHPRLVELSWDVPYSVFTLAGLFGLTWYASGGGFFGGELWAYYVAYVLHVGSDYVTHTGEWQIRPLYPFSRWPIPALTSAWDWPTRYYALCWVVLAFLLYLL